MCPPIAHTTIFGNMNPWSYDSRHQSATDWRDAELSESSVRQQRTRDDARSGRCFICSIVAGTREDHRVIYRDEICIAFLAKAPTLLGYSLLAPLEHRTDVVADFTEDEYLDL